MVHPYQGKFMIMIIINELPLSRFEGVCAQFVGWTWGGEAAERRADKADVTLLSGGRSVPAEARSRQVENQPMRAAARKAAEHRHQTK